MSNTKSRPAYAVDIDGERIEADDPATFLANVLDLSEGDRELPAWTADRATPGGGAAADLLYEVEKVRDGATYSLWAALAAILTPAPVAETQVALGRATYEHNIAASHAMRFAGEVRALRQVGSALVRGPEAGENGILEASRIVAKLVGDALDTQPREMATILAAAHADSDAAAADVFDNYTGDEAEEWEETARTMFIYERPLDLTVMVEVSGGQVVVGGRWSAEVLLACNGPTTSFLVESDGSATWATTDNRAGRRVSVDFASTTGVAEALAEFVDLLTGGEVA